MDGLLGLGTTCATVMPMAASPSLLAHIAAEGEGDPLFYLSHRYYLAKGLNTKSGAKFK